MNSLVTIVYLFITNEYKKITLNVLPFTNVALFIIFFYYKPLVVNIIMMKQWCCTSSYNL